MEEHSAEFHELIAGMSDALCRVDGPAMVSRDLRDLPDFRGLDLRSAASLLVTAHQGWRCPAAAAALVLPLGITSTVQTAVPDFERSWWNEATLYRFNLDYLRAAALDLQQYRTPVCRLTDQTPEVLVSFQSTRSLEWAAQGWEFSSDLLLTVAPEAQVSCL